MLDYTGGAASVLDGEAINENIRAFAGNAEDFKLLRCELPADGTSTSLPPSEGPQIILGIRGTAVTNGGVEVGVGSISFVPAGQTLRFSAVENALVFVASCNDSFF